MNDPSKCPDGHDLKQWVTSTGMRVTYCPVCDSLDNYLQALNERHKGRVEQIRKEYLRQIEALYERHPRVPKEIVDVFLKAGEPDPLPCESEDTNAVHGEH